jgi:hypothetical protein
MVGKAAQGASQALGYGSERRETGYPTAPQSMFLTPPHRPGLVAGGAAGGTTQVDTSQALWGSSQSGMSGNSFSHDIGLQQGGSGTN